MRLLLTAVAIGLAIPAAGRAGDKTPKTVRTCWNSMSSQPYGDCSYLEVTGPEAARAQILERAKKQYREPDPAALAAVEDKVIVRVASMGYTSCASHVPTEIVFVDKETDEPALRVPLANESTVLQNGFGAQWTSTDGIGIVSAEEFRKALAGDAKFNAVVVLKSGDSYRMKAGARNVPWSGKHTAKVFGED